MAGGRCFLLIREGFLCCASGSDVQGQDKALLSVPAWLLLGRRGLLLAEIPT